MSVENPFKNDTSQQKEMFADNQPAIEGGPATPEAIAEQERLLGESLNRLGINAEALETVEPKDTSAWKERLNAFQLKLGRLDAKYGNIAMEIFAGTALASTAIGAGLFIASRMNPDIVPVSPGWIVGPDGSMTNFIENIRTAVAAYREANEHAQGAYGATSALSYVGIGGMAGMVGAGLTRAVGWAHKKLSISGSEFSNQEVKHG